MALQEKGTVMVFAPVPQLTVTVERQSGEEELHVHPGGQGIWQARMCAGLGASVTLCAAVGGEIGGVIESLLAQERLEVHTVRRSSASGWYVHDRRTGSRDPVAEHAGAPLGRHDLDELYGHALAAGLRSRVSILSGPAAPDVVAPEVYRRLAADLTAHGGTVVADLSGDHLTAVLDGGVAFLKVSHEELLDAGRAADDSVETLVAAAHDLRKEGATSVLISRADQPGIALIDDRPMLVTLPSLQVVDHRGAGDSMTAGVATVLSQGGDLREAVRTGAAAGALNVTRHGLGTGRREAIEELTGRVRLTPIS
ncbi:PfkB family carbohydrate kinase [Actinoplanes sp. NBRC 101535]|uniref:1-phosphofructokinase family hexose kinase n=1 Tax=Actinoplanes sp. NBRC 101535 TaxID=3032196 RepID=UPI0024A3780E|nr:PfkB family carbohydrate kinase [Actinoplanes sp. NBRC 101535]GLY07347.1 1-phosphofructokinase [Actinoplanes sp. NBRC 101535]